MEGIEQEIKDLNMKILQFESYLWKASLAESKEGEEAEYWMNEYRRHFGILIGCFKKEQLQNEKDRI